MTPAKKKINQIFLLITTFLRTVQSKHINQFILIHLTIHKLPAGGIDHFIFVIDHIPIIAHSAQFLLLRHALSNLFCGETQQVLLTPE